jgi:lipopolysaccharide/colanic/teichoic acid biosynthesis glycosyltransferase
MSQRGVDYIEGDLKRGLDLTGGLLAAAVLSPVAAAVAAEVMIEHQTLNPFFAHERVGRYATSIMVHKFATLRVHRPSDELHGGFQHPDASPAGTLIRRLGLDEIPQLGSVIKGDLSLVGIRPLPQAYIDYYRSFIRPKSLFSEWYEYYQLNPGLTGRGQLYAKRFPKHTPETVRQVMRLEVAASRDASLWNDLQVIMATPPVVLGNALGLNIGPCELPLELDEQSEVATMATLTI